MFLEMFTLDWTVSWNSLGLDTIPIISKPSGEVSEFVCVFVWVRVGGSDNGDTGKK